MPFTLDHTTAFQLPPRRCPPGTTWHPDIDHQVVRARLPNEERPLLASANTKAFPASGWQATNRHPKASGGTPPPSAFFLVSGYTHTTALFGSSRISSRCSQTLHTSIPIFHPIRRVMSFGHETYSPMGSTLSVSCPVPMVFSIPGLGCLTCPYPLPAWKSICTGQP